MLEIGSKPYSVVVLGEHLASCPQHRSNVVVVEDKLVNVAPEIAHFGGHVLPHSSQLLSRLLVIGDSFVH